MNQTPEWIPRIALIVSIYAAVLSTAVGMWGIISWRLSGGRPKVTLIAGVSMNDRGALLRITDLRSVRTAAALDAQLEKMVRRSFGKPIIGVEVANIGRLGITVSRWEIESNAKVSIAPMRGASGPELPCEIGPGKAECWFIELGEVIHSVGTAADIFKTGQPEVMAVVTLATGEKRRTRVSLQLPLPPRS